MFRDVDLQRGAFAEKLPACHSFEHQSKKVVPKGGLEPPCG